MGVDNYDPRKHDLYGQGEPYDEEDRSDSLTDGQRGRAIAEMLMVILDCSSDISVPDNVKSLPEWLSEGKMLSLACGQARGEKAFAEEFGFQPQKIILTDRNVPKDILKLKEELYTFQQTDILSWAQGRIQNREDASLDTFRVITLFGIEYFVHNLDMSEISQVAVGLHTSLELSGILILSHQIPLLARELLKVGFTKIDSAGMYFQKQTR